jgi:DNA-binding winged helix-turn-helix (wHTH) protein
VRFGVFEIDLRAGELRKKGIRIKLQGQPFLLLITLLKQRGDLVTRDELRRTLWPEDTFIDFDHSLGTAINKLREVLGDSAANPRFIETLPRRGYRFNGSSQRDVLPNAFDRSLQYGNSDFDHRHVAVINLIYQLPFYKDSSTLTGKLLGGWQISEVTQFQTGSPVSVQTGDDFAGVGPGSGNSGNANDGFSTRWIVNGNIAQPGQFGAGGQYYAFQKGVNILQPAQGTFTDQRSRNIFYQPGFQNWNFGVFKEIHTTEKQFATLRFEMFNWLNHPNWGGVTGGGLDVNPNDGNFGKVTTKDSQRQLQLSLRYTF